MCMIAISTDYVKTMAHNEHIKGILKQIADAGISYIHWCHEWNGVYQYSEAEMHQLKAWIDQASLGVMGVHASDGTLHGHFDDRKMFISPNEANRVAGVELVKNRIDLANVFDAGEIVLHLKLLHIILPNTQYAIFADTYWDQLFKSLDEIIVYAKTKSIKVAIENLEHPFESIQVEQFDKLFARYSKDELGFCFDLGHNMITGVSDPFSFLEKYNDRLIRVHLNGGLPNVDLTNDYVEVLKLDLHKVPEKDDLDFDRLAQLIAKSPYQLPVCFEIVAGKDVAKSLNDTLELGNYLNDLINKYRSGSEKIGK